MNLEYTKKANDLLKYDERFRYMLLGRMQEDCKYYLGYGGRCKKYLWANDVDLQIYLMRILLDSFAEEKKPEWIRKEDIDEYERLMKDDSITVFQKYI